MTIFHCSLGRLHKTGLTVYLSTFCPHGSQIIIICFSVICTQIYKQVNRLKQVINRDDIDFQLFFFKLTAFCRIINKIFLILHIYHRVKKKVYLKKMEHVAGLFSEGEIKHVTTNCNLQPFSLCRVGNYYWFLFSQL